VAANQLKTLDVRTVSAWRAWLQKNHRSETEVWLVFHKRHTGVPSIEYGDALDEALCFGWIDSLIKRLDDDRYARKFTPRKTNSRWSTINRKRYEALKASGRLKAAGLALAPTGRSGDLPKVSGIPDYIERAIKRNKAAWKFFQGLAPSYQRLYIAFVDSAKQEATKAKRLQQVMERLVAGEKPGMM
jgi:uncharacterized protein YdeI (YjbR/CyaY-like superfamily)